MVLSLFSAKGNFATRCCRIEGLAWQLAITNELAFPETDTRFEEMRFQITRIAYGVVQNVGTTLC